MSQYHQPGFWPTDYWVEDYWPAAGAATPLVRTEPITYAPNSYYVKGYWADIYWPVAPVPSAVKDVYFRGMYRNKFKGMR
jgi:hypothetical protein